MLSFRRFPLIHSLKNMSDYKQYLPLEHGDVTKLFVRNHYLVVALRSKIVRFDII